MPAFEEDDIRLLEQLLVGAVARARSRRLAVTRETLARRLFEAASAGERDPDTLIEYALDIWDDDDFVPPALDVGALPSGAPIWQPASAGA